MLVQVSDIGAAHLGTSSIDLDEALHFEPSVGGALEFKLIDSDKVLGRVEVKPNDIEAEIVVLDEHKAEAYASIKQGVETADEGRVDRFQNIRGQTDVSKYQITLISFCLESKGA